MTATITLALAGDTMLGRSVGARLRDDPHAPLLAPEIVAAAAEADRFVLNLECCVSVRGARFDEPGKPFFFRAPPAAAERLAEMGVNAVTLANNHALDYGADALLDTLDHLHAVGIATVGAGADEPAARAPLEQVVGGLRIRFVGLTDHPAAYAAARTRPGVAFADLAAGALPGWVARSATPDAAADIVVVLPHWGPNMRARPVPHVRNAARRLVDAGAALVAGHSAHVFQGVDGRVIYDLGDFLDDYATDPRLRNDLGLLWLVTLDPGGPRRIEAIPLRLDHCYTRRATGPDADWVARRFSAACAAMGTSVRRGDDGRLVIAED